MKLASRIAAIALAATLPWVAAAALADREPPWDGWRVIQLKTRKMLFFTGRVRLTVREETGRTILETHSYARFLGVELTRTRTRTVIDNESGRTLEYSSLSAKRGRRYRFHERGYTMQKLSPVRGPRAPIDRWRVTESHEFAYPDAAPGTEPPAVLDYYGMLLRFGDAALARPGDEVRYVVATSRGPRSYTVRVGETRHVRRSLRDDRDGKRRRVPLRELRLRILPDDPDGEREGFLDMEGETEIWVESASRTLVEISGKIPRVPGRVVVALDSIR